MTEFLWALLLTGGWFAVALAVGIPLGRFLRINDERAQRQLEPDTPGDLTAYREEMAERRCKALLAASNSRARRGA